MRVAPRPDRRRPARALAALLGTVLLTVLLAGCGGEPSTPGEKVPELAETLDDLDTALADEQYDEARVYLAQMRRTTLSAREDGELDRAEARRVLDAVQALLAKVPEPREEPEPSPTPSPPPEEPSDTPTETPTRTPTPTESESESESPSPSESPSVLPGDGSGSSSDTAEAG
jgi:hypothetical protein